MAKAAASTEWCDRSLINTPFSFTVCTTETAFHRLLGKLGIEHCPWIKNTWSNATAHFYPADKDRAACALVCIRGWEGKDPIVVAGLLVHEAVHLWQEVCANLGEDHPSVEFEAYGIQWISQQLMWEFQRQTRGDQPA